MKVVFLNPPAIKGRAPDRNFGCNYGVTFQQPIHILYPAAVLEKEGYEVEFIDCPVEGKNDKWCENYIKTNDISAVIFFTVYLAEKTDIYWAKQIREFKKDVNIIFMGPEPSLNPSKFIFDDKVFVVRGEPEYTILELFRTLKTNKSFKDVLSLSWMNKGDVTDNPPRPFIDNLDEIPFPARHLIKTPRKYFNPKLRGRPTTTMFTSRQCWGRCIYCIPAAYNFTREIEWKKHFNKKPPVRLRSPENIYEEFKLLKEHGYNSVAIMDDNFMGLKTSKDKERITKICQLIQHLKMEWGCLARADQLQDEEVLKWMKKAGCVYVDIGVESFNQKVLDYVQKDTSVGEQFNAILLLKKVGIEPKINILLGASPLQTEEDIKWTVEILKMFNIEFVSFGVVIPHPGIEFYKTVKEEGWFSTSSKDFEPVDPYADATVDFPNMSHERLEKLVKWAYRAHYLRLSYILKRLTKIRSFNELIENIKSVWNLFIRK
jgi:radical SAM superfamily enzyme YgiQ (UPF0313 family)